MPLEHEGIRQIDMDRVAQIARLRAVNAKLLAALEGQGGRGRGIWHLWTCPKRACLWECKQARAAIEEAKK